MQLIDAVYKDSDPMDTVRRIKQILNDHNLATTEIWQESVIPYCHAMSVTVNGLTLKSNGKGLTREFAMASGYGELMERLQLGLTGSGEGQKTALREDAVSITEHDETLLKNAPGRYERLSERLEQATGIKLSARQLLSRFASADSTLSVREYHHLSTGEADLLPTELVRRVYGTNGCAAGNTPEEALVQAISEIMERHNQLRIIHEGLTPPDLPEETLRSCPAAWEIICFLRDHGFQVTVKDCSLGSPFPVVCVCLINKKTGAYHTHFGAFPLFEIALERALTESFQGRTLATVAEFNDYSNKKPGQHSLEVISNEVAYGSWKKPLSFFQGTPSYPAQTEFGFTGQDNKTLLKQCIDYLTDLGYDILVRDHSALGFPTYQVIIPGFSEVMIHRLSQNLDDTRYSVAASDVLRNPTKASLSDAIGLLLHLQQLDEMGGKIKDKQGFTGCARISAKLDRITSEKLMISSLCSVHYSMGRWTDVIRGIDRLMTLSSEKDIDRLICLKQYLTQLSAGRDRASIRDVLNICHRSEMISWLYDHLNNRRNPFEDFVLHCDEIKCDGCPIQFQCCQVYTRNVSVLISHKAAQLDQKASINSILL